MSESVKLQPLPQSDDEYWEGANVARHTAKPVPLCNHSKSNWMSYEYINNNDGTVSCKTCGWGTPIPGYLRCHNGKIIDLRSQARG